MEIFGYTISTTVYWVTAIWIVGWIVTYQRGYEKLSCHCFGLTIFPFPLMQAVIMYIDWDLYEGFWSVLFHLGGYYILGFAIFLCWCGLSEIFSLIDDRNTTPEYKDHLRRNEIERKEMERDKNTIEDMSKYLK